MFLPQLAIQQPAERHVAIAVAASSDFKLCIDA